MLKYHTLITQSLVNIKLLVLNSPISHFMKVTGSVIFDVSKWLRIIIMLIVKKKMTSSLLRYLRKCLLTYNKLPCRTERLGIRGGNVFNCEGFPHDGFLFEVL